MNIETVIIPTNPEVPAEVIVLPKEVPGQVATERPAPSNEDQVLSDGVFGDEINQLAGVLLSMQAGGAMLKHVMTEMFPPKPAEEEDEKKRRPDEKPCC
jgi:hypothetical protein